MYILHVIFLRARYENWRSKDNYELIVEQLDFNRTKSRIETRPVTISLLLHY